MAWASNWPHPSVTDKPDDAMLLDRWIRHRPIVMPAKAGIYNHGLWLWAPAFAGATMKRVGSL